MRIFLSILLFAGLLVFSGCGNTVCSTGRTTSCSLPSRGYYEPLPSSYYQPAVSEFDSGPGYYDIVKPSERPVGVNVDVITGNNTPTCDPCSAWRGGMGA